MGLKIRMRQQGRSNRPFYRVVLTDIRAPRDGKYMEALGWYNPVEKEAEKNFFLNADRIDFWVKQGAQLSDNVKALVLKTAPDVIKAQTQKGVLKREKARAKRKEAKKPA